MTSCHYMSVSSILTNSGHVTAIPNVSGQTKTSKLLLTKCSFKLSYIQFQFPLLRLPWPWDSKSIKLLNWRYGQLVTSALQLLVFCLNCQASADYPATTNSDISKSHWLIPEISISPDVGVVINCLATEILWLCALTGIPHLPAPKHPYRLL